ncbi:MAG: 1-acyl-sn-glycerol-3-phosphate acyltransferase [Pseudomonadota bacterium]|nr:1-acyl-sn-glycerol-3-phosphate acyltransferase [Pseudomonadota bacterium]
MSSSLFDRIRPYRDREVPAVVQRLVESDDLVQAMIHVQYPLAQRYLEKPLTRFVRYRIEKNLRGIQTVEEFQQRMRRFLEGTIEKSITEFTFAGQEHLQASVPYVFISNHRDITLDSALLNYALVQAGLDTAEIAIGDNLLTNPLISDLLRLNKSFVVNRSVTGVKAKYQALTELSHYINQASAEGRSIWIAQREGRAKDGFDITDPAILKMLHLWPRKQGVSFADTMARLNLVPVSISYEYDPCDGLKAAELQARAEADYVKRDGEDVESILRGIALPKGRVHIEIGAPLQERYADSEALARALDAQIIKNYRVFPPALLAIEHLLNLGKAMQSLRDDSMARLQAVAQQAGEALSGVDSQELARQAADFSSRLAHYPAQLQRYILEMYANPLLNKYDYAST